MARTAVEDVAIAAFESGAAAFADFAAVLLLTPDVPRWTAEEKGALGEIIAAKAGRTELRYLHLLQKHPRLRAAILKLGL